MSENLRIESNCVPIQFFTACKLFSNCDIVSRISHLSRQLPHHVLGSVAKLVGKACLEI